MPYFPSPRTIHLNTSQNHLHSAPPRPQSSFITQLHEDFSDEDEPEDYDATQDLIDPEEALIQQLNQLSFVERMQRSTKEKKFLKTMERLRNEEQQKKIPAIVEKVQTHSFFGEEYSPMPRSEHQFVSCDAQQRLFFLFGGKGGDNDVEEYFNDLHLYDRYDRLWQYVERPKRYIESQKHLLWPAPRASHTIVIHPFSHCIWMFGGQVHFGEKTNELWTMDVKRRLEWQQVHPKNTEETIAPISHHSCVFYHSEEDPQVAQFIEECEKDEAKMRKEKPLLDALPHEYLVVFGGDTGAPSKEAQNVTWIFDLDSQKWERLKTRIVPYVDPFNENAQFDIPSCSRDQHGKLKEGPPARTEHSAVLYERGKMIIFGGIDENQRQFNDVWMLNLWRKEWSHIPTYLIRGLKPSPRSKHSACIAGRDMYVAFGGVPFSNSIFRLDLRTRRWTEVEFHQISPLPRVGASLHLLEIFSENEERHAADMLDLYKSEAELRRAAGESDEENVEEELDQQVLKTPRAKRVNYRRARLMMFGGSTFDAKQGTKHIFNEMFEIDVGQLQEVRFTPRPSRKEIMHDQYNYGRIWSTAERERFEEGRRACGDKWEVISRDYVQTRNANQCRNYAATMNQPPHSNSSMVTRKSKIKFGKWSDEEERRFMEGVREHGKDFAAIAKLVKSRNEAQVRTRFQQYLRAKEVNNL